MKYLEFLKKNIFKVQWSFLTGETETTLYEFRFGMMIGYHN